VSAHYASLPPPSLSSFSAVPPNPASYASSYENYAASMSLLIRRSAVSVFVRAIPRGVIFNVRRRSIVRVRMAETSGGRQTRRMRGPKQGRRRSGVWASKRWPAGEQFVAVSAKDRRRARHGTRGGGAAAGPGAEGGGCAGAGCQLATSRSAVRGPEARPPR
jgi:hypothetical protein